MIHKNACENIVCERAAFLCSGGAVVVVVVVVVVGGGGIIWTNESIFYRRIYESTYVWIVAWRSTHINIDGTVSQTFVKLFIKWYFYAIQKTLLSWLNLRGWLLSGFSYIVPYPLSVHLLNSNIKGMYIYIYVDI